MKDLFSLLIFGIYSMIGIIIIAIFVNYILAFY